MDSNIPQVSVIIPLYNKAPYIKRALDSVLAQTVQDFEVVVVNDGSKDSGEKIVEEYTDTRIHIINQENHGVSTARNRGVDAARAELVAFLDADDEWLPEFLETILRLRKKWPEAGMYTTNSYINGNYRNRCLRSKNIEDGKNEGIVQSYFRHVALHGEINFTISTAISKNIFLQKNGFNPKFVIHEDLDLWDRIAYNHPICYSEKPCAVYHIEASASLQQISDNYNNITLPFVDYFNELPKDEVICRADYDDICLYIESLKYREVRILSYFDGKKARHILKQIKSKELMGLKWVKAYIGTYKIIRLMYDKIFFK